MAKSLQSFSLLWKSNFFVNEIEKRGLDSELRPIENSKKKLYDTLSYRLGPVISGSDREPSDRRNPGGNMLLIICSSICTSLVPS